MLPSLNCELFWQEKPRLRIGKKKSGETRQASSPPVRPRRHRHGFSAGVRRLLLLRVSCHAVCCCRAGRHHRCRLHLSSSVLSSAPAVVPPSASPSLFFYPLSNLSCSFRLQVVPPFCRHYIGSPEAVVGRGSLPGVYGRHWSVPVSSLAVLGLSSSPGQPCHLRRYADEGGCLQMEARFFTSLLEGRGEWLVLVHQWSVADLE